MHCNLKAATHSMPECSSYNDDENNPRSYSTYCPWKRALFIIVTDSSHYTVNFKVPHSRVCGRVCGSMCIQLRKMCYSLTSDTIAESMQSFSVDSHNSGSKVSIVSLKSPVSVLQLGTQRKTDKHAGTLSSRAPLCMCFLLEVRKTRNKSLSAPSAV